MVDEVDVVNALDLGDDQGVDPVGRPFDHRNDVLVAPLRIARIDPDGSHFAGELVLPQSCHDLLAGLYLDRRRDRVFQVENHLVGSGMVSLRKEARLVSWYDKTRPSSSQRSTR